MNPDAQLEIFTPLHSVEQLLCPAVRKVSLPVER